jgi:hypothetical protein
MPYEMKSEALTRCVALRRLFGLFGDGVTTVAFYFALCRLISRTRLVRLGLYPLTQTLLTIILVVTLEGWRVGWERDDE